MLVDAFCGGIIFLMLHVSFFFFFPDLHNFEPHIDRPRCVQLRAASIPIQTGRLRAEWNVPSGTCRGRLVVRIREHLKRQTQSLRPWVDLVGGRNATPVS